MILEGLKLAVLGMGIVYLFLSLVVISINISNRVLASTTQREIEAEEAKMKNARKSRGQKGVNGAKVQNDSTLVAVISSAISMHKKK